MYLLFRLNLPGEIKSDSDQAKYIADESKLINLDVHCNKSY